MWLLKCQDAQMLQIAQQSMQSLMLTMRCNGVDVGHGTGFIVKLGSGIGLVTNRHNVTGRYQGSGKPIAATGAVPNEIAIFHPLAFDKQRFTPAWEERVEPLYADGSIDGERLWKEHPRYGSRVDFVLLPLTRTEGITSTPYSMTEGATIAVQPAETVSVVGFPFAIAAGGRFAVWAAGTVATEPETDYNDLPLFLIDCRTRPGQSGSPVIARRQGMITLTNGKQVPSSGTVSRFLGIYSGRVHKDADIGMVWKASAIQELIHAVAPPITLFKLWPGIKPA
jgi:hypothetical protein